MEESWIKCKLQHIIHVCLISSDSCTHLIHSGSTRLVIGELRGGRLHAIAAGLVVDFHLATTAVTVVVHAAVELHVQPHVGVGQLRGRRVFHLRSGTCFVRDLALEADGLTLELQIDFSLDDLIVHHSIHGQNGILDKE